MPVLRNVNLGRHSGRHTPVIYDGDGWPTCESLNHISNGEPLNDTMLQYPTSFFKPDHQYSHSCQQEQKPCISPDGLPYHPSIIDTSCLAPPLDLEKHSRRRESGHVPRPRNAFFIFRSFYVSTTGGKELQNELSKQVGKVWNDMTEYERRPFTALAHFEKKQHQLMFPDYIYGPTARRKSMESGKKVESSELTPTNTLLASANFTAPEIPSTAFGLRASAQLAIQRFLQVHSISAPASSLPGDSPVQETLEDAYLEPKFPAKVDVTFDTKASESMEDDDFVPTADIPELELTPSKKEEPEHTFDLFMRPSHLDCIPEQFGVCPNKSTNVFSHLPPMPSLNGFDAGSTADAPPSCSRTPSPSEFCSKSVSEEISDSYTFPGVWRLTPCLKKLQQPVYEFASTSRTLSPANFLTTTLTCSTSVVPINRNVPDGYLQRLPNGLAAPRQSVPGFTWSLDHENDRDDYMSSENTTLEKDMPFMSSLFDFDCDSLQ